MASTTLFDPWSPPRPFPARVWLVGHLPFRVPPLRAPTRPRQSRRITRHELELRVLVSGLPPWLRAHFMPTLRQEVRRRFPWSRERCAAGPLMIAQGRFPPPALASGTIAWLRSMLIAECELGLTTVRTPPGWLNRPQRNLALAMRATRLRQLTEALERCPEAEPLEQEARRALDALRR